MAAPKTEVRQLIQGGAAAAAIEANLLRGVQDLVQKLSGEARLPEKE